MGAPYFFPFACFGCHRCFKRSLPREGKTKKCPHCGGAAIRMGRHFKAPGVKDTSAWEVVRLLVAHGFLYDRIYTDVSANEKASFPTTMAEARKFIEAHESRLSAASRMEVNRALRGS